MKNKLRKPRRINTNASVAAWLPLIIEAIKALNLKAKIEGDKVYISIGADEQVAVSPTSDVAGKYEKQKREGTTTSIIEEGDYDTLAALADVINGLSANSSKSTAMKDGKQVLRAGKNHSASILASRRGVVNLDSNFEDSSSEFIAATPDKGLVVKIYKNNSNEWAEELLYQHAESEEYLGPFNDEATYAGSLSESEVLARIGSDFGNKFIKIPFEEAKQYINSSKNLNSVTKITEGGGDINEFLKWHDDAEMYRKYPEMFDTIYDMIDAEVPDKENENVDDVFQWLSPETQKEIMELIRTTYSTNSSKRRKSMNSSRQALNKASQNKVKLNSSKLAESIAPHAEFMEINDSILFEVPEGLDGVEPGTYIAYHDEEDNVYITVPVHAETLQEFDSVADLVAMMTQGMI